MVAKELQAWIERVLAAGAISRAGRRQIAGEVESVGLTDQDFLVLWLCGHCDAGRGQNELAELVGASAAQISGLVERLRRREFLRFERHATDRRRQVWQLTASGRTLLLEVCQRLSDPSASQVPATPDQGGPSSCAA